MSNAHPQISKAILMTVGQAATRMARLRPTWISLQSSGNLPWALETINSTWIQSGWCRGGPSDGAVGPGDPYPRDAFYPPPEEGPIYQIPGWDSRPPLTWVLEHPTHCHLVPEEETIHIGQWDIFATKRYSDVCDYIMTCMYEERSEIFAGKPYWFKTQTDDMLFYLSINPIPIRRSRRAFAFTISFQKASRTMRS